MNPSSILSDMLAVISRLYVRTTEDSKEELLSPISKLIPM